MKQDNRLLFGPVGAVIFVFGVAGLALMVPGYSHVHQTVSEIGEVGSPARIPFTIMMCCVAACMLVFAAGVRSASVKANRSQIAAYLIGFIALSAVGVGVFAFPNPLHNVFGESELIGYQAPLALALAWRTDSKAKKLAISSWIMFVLIWISLLLNMSSIDRHGVIWAYLKPIYGVVQRSLFALWFGWCALAGVLMRRYAQRNPA